MADELNKLVVEWKHRHGAELNDALNVLASQIGMMIGGVLPSRELRRQARKVVQTQIEKSERDALSQEASILKEIGRA